MTTLSIKDVPESLATRLRVRAASNHRSLQGELMALIEAAVGEPAPDFEKSLAGRTLPAASAPRPQLGLGLQRSQAARPRKSTEQIAAEHRSRYPRALDGQALGVDIVRADRDAR